MAKYSFVRCVCTVLGAFLFAMLGQSASGESSTAFGKMGPYQVSMSEVADQGILLVPSVADAKNSTLCTIGGEPTPVISISKNRRRGIG